MTYKPRVFKPKAAPVPVERKSFGLRRSDGSAPRKASGLPWYKVMFADNARDSARVDKMLQAKPVTPAYRPVAPGDTLTL